MGKNKGKKKAAAGSSTVFSTAPAEALTLGIDTMSLFQDISSTDTVGMSELEKLPGKARKEILRYLLHADRVRKPINKYGQRNYAFQPAILRVSRRLSAEAKAILYGENIIIRVLMHRVPDGFIGMINHEVTFLKNGLKSAFEKHVVNIETKPDKRLCPLLHNETPHRNIMNDEMMAIADNHFLLLKQDIPKFTRYLRIMDIANPYFWHYKFDFLPTFSGETLSLSDQKDILEPFKSLPGTKMVQTVAFTGTVDQTLMKEVSDAMTQKVQWARAGAWELYDIASSIKGVGDELWQAGFHDLAFAKWDNVSAWITQSVKENGLLMGFDRRADVAGLRIHMTCDMDRSLYILSPHGQIVTSEPREWKMVLELCNPEKFKEMAGRGSDVVSVFQRPLSHHERRAYYFRGLAELGLDHPNKAAKNFASAVKLNPQNAKYRSGYDVARGWASASETERQDRLNNLLSQLPDPFPREDWNPYMTFEVQSEQYCLRKMGFKGPFPLEDKIKPCFGTVMKTSGNTGPMSVGVCTLGYVKYSKMREYMTAARKQMREARELQGLPENKLMFWVRLSASQLGEGIPGVHYPENEGE